MTGDPIDQNKTTNKGEMADKYLCMRIIVALWSEDPRADVRMYECTNARTRHGEREQTSTQMQGSITLPVNTIRLLFFFCIFI